MMESANITKAILSISTPGSYINDKLGVGLTRQCNAYASSLKKEHPEKFGFWASSPLPNVSASLSEIDTAWREGADGFGLLTNYHGRYLGDAAFDGVFEKLNELSATVFIHPTAPCIHGGEGVGCTHAVPFGATYPIAIFEFFFDTARAVVNLFTSGTIDRCPNIRFIIPHAGGALPPLFTRFVKFSAMVPGGRALDAAVVRRQLDEQFYFDFAGFVFDGDEGEVGQLKALVEGLEIGSGKLMYGSDFPFTKNAGC